MYPPPTKAISAGSWSNSKNCVLLMRCSSPGIPRLAGFAPAATTMNRAVSRCPATSSELASTNFDRPWKLLMPAFSNDLSFSLGTGSVKDRLKRMSSGQSMVSLPLIVWFSNKRLEKSSSSAVPTRTFFGSQPRSAHVPPNGSESITATLHPAARHWDATVEPAVPLPITTRSNLSCTLLFLAFWLRRIARVGGGLHQRLRVGLRVIKAHHGQFLFVIYIHF